MQLRLLIAKAGLAAFLLGAAGSAASAAPSVAGTYTGPLPLVKVQMVGNGIGGDCGYGGSGDYILRLVVVQKGDSVRAALTVGDRQYKAIRKKVRVRGKRLRAVFKWPAGTGISGKGQVKLSKITSTGAAAVQKSIFRQIDSKNGCIFTSAGQVIRS